MPMISSKLNVFLRHYCIKRQPRLWCGQVQVDNGRGKSCMAISMFTCTCYLGQNFFSFTGEEALVSRILI
jgi:hypothetical protein